MNKNLSNLKNKLKEINEEVIEGGKLMTVYHRTSSDIENFLNGIKTGSSQSHGVGFYSTVDLESQLNTRMKMAYGNNILKLKTNVSDFLIFDPVIAKKVYGDKWRIIDQISVMGISKNLKNKLIDVINLLIKRKILNDKISLTMLGANRSEDDYKTVLQGYKNSKLGDGDLVKELASNLRNKYNEILRGVIYNSFGDGLCAVIYDISSIIPISVATEDKKEKKLIWNKLEPSKKLLKSLIPNISNKEGSRDLKIFNSLLDKNYLTKADNMVDIILKHIDNNYRSNIVLGLQVLRPKLLKDIISGNHDNLYKLYFNMYMREGIYHAPHYFVSEIFYIFSEKGDRRVKNRLFEAISYWIENSSENKIDEILSFLTDLKPYIPKEEYDYFYKKIQMKR
jgi:hypothetical protein